MRAVGASRDESQVSLPYTAYGKDYTRGGELALIEAIPVCALKRTLFFISDFRSPRAGGGAGAELERPRRAGHGAGAQPAAPRASSRIGYSGARRGAPRGTSSRVREFDVGMD